MAFDLVHVWVMSLMALIIFLIDGFSLAFSRWRNSRIWKLVTCSALGGESEVIARNFLDFPHEASRKKALPWNTALGLSKGVMGTSRLNSFKTLSSRALGARHSFPDLMWSLWLFLLLAISIWVIRISMPKDEPGKCTDEIQTSLIKTRVENSDETRHQGQFGLLKIFVGQQLCGGSMRAASRTGGDSGLGYVSAERQVLDVQG